jgi:hypothetical protein
VKFEQRVWTADSGWDKEPSGQICESANLVLVFGGTNIFRNPGLVSEIKCCYLNAQIIGCSTAGEIFGTKVLDDSIVLTAIVFESTHIHAYSKNIKEFGDSFSAGKSLAQSLQKNGLKSVFVLSDGLNINGSELVKGLRSTLSEDIIITGGLAADGDRFKKTFVLHNEKVESGLITVIGFYGESIKIGCGSLGGWDPFGPERIITRSKGNIVYEFDGKPSLELYKRYLGDHANGLPATGLLFPLSVKTEGNNSSVVRTILSINEDEQSLIFAGDVPQGSYSQLMKANFDRLIDGAIGAARYSLESFGSSKPELAILISCVGRKLILKQRIEEEVESVQDIFGKSTIMTGFYSYGEISPINTTGKCELHNQTMTITTLSEQ